MKRIKLLSHKAYKEASRISVYLSMPEEVDTSLIIEVWLCLYTIMLHIFKNCRTSLNRRSMLFCLLMINRLLFRLCFVPQFNDVQMNMLQVHSLEDIKSLPAYKWGIKQPACK